MRENNGRVKLARGKKKLIRQYETLCSSGRASVGDKLKIAMFCRRMGWTYEQFLDQPFWFVDILMEMENIEEDYKRLWRKQGLKQ